MGIGNDIGQLWGNGIILSCELMIEGVIILSRKITEIFCKIIEVLAQCGKVRKHGKINELQNGDISRKAGICECSGIFDGIVCFVGIIWGMIFGICNKKRVLSCGESSLDGYWIGVDPADEDGDHGCVYKISDIREG